MQPENVMPLRVVLSESYRARRRWKRAEASQPHFALVAYLYPRKDTFTEGTDTELAHDLLRPSSVNRSRASNEEPS